MQRKDNFVVGEYYHIYNRGIDKRVIFKSQFDYERFIMLLKVANSLESFRLDHLINHQHKDINEILSMNTGEKLISIGAWCLMENHFHILLKEEIEGGISKFMKKLGTGYSMYFNIKYNRTGSLFGGPFKSKHISQDIYLKHLFGYIHLNPLSIKFFDWEQLIDSKDVSNLWKEFLRNYQFSSYRDYEGIDRVEKNILDKKSFPEYFLEDNSFEDFIDSYICFNKNT